MKNTFMMIFSLLVLLTLAACGGGDEADQDEAGNEEPATEEETAPNEEAEEPAEEEEPSSEVGKRSNPVKAGESVTIPGTVYSDEGEEANGELTISLSHFVRGQEAMDFLLSENEFNEEPPDGQEWMIFDVSVEASIDNPDIPYYAMPVFNVFDSSGSPVSQDTYATFASDEFGYQDIYDGGTHTGKAAVIVPEEEDVLIEYSDMEFTAFFSTE